MARDAAAKSLVPALMEVAEGMKLAPAPWQLKGIRLTLNLYSESRGRGKSCYALQLGDGLSCIHLRAGANIGVHHVHHLCSRIPFYRLQRVLRDHPELNVVGRLTFVQSLGCVRLVLWDEERRRLISFRELRRSST